jgi:hypothetical protein
MKKYLLYIFLLLLAPFGVKGVEISLDELRSLFGSQNEPTFGATILFPYQGGTGLGSATAGQVGTCLKVSDDSPFTYELGTCGSGSGGSSNWSFGPNQLFIYPSTTVGIIVSASSTFIGNFKIDGNATATSLVIGSTVPPFNPLPTGDLFVGGKATTVNALTIGSSVAANQEAFNFAGGDLYVQNDAYIGRNATTSGNLSVSGVVYAGDGDVTPPSYTFASDPDTGFYHPGGNEVSFVANGIEQFNLNAASGLTFVPVSTFNSVVTFQSGFISGLHSTATSLVIGDGAPSPSPLRAGQFFINDTATSTGNLTFMAELMPDGATCSNGQILKKTGVNDWDCSADANSGGTANGAWESIFTGTALRPTNTAAGIFVSASSSIAANFRVDGKATATTALWVGSGGNAISLDLAGGDLYVQGDVRIDGSIYNTSGFIEASSSAPEIDLAETDVNETGSLLMSAGNLRITAGSQSNDYVRFMSSIDLQGVFVASTFIPITNDSFDLGSNTRGWAGLWLGPDECISFGGIECVIAEQAVGEVAGQPITGLILQGWGVNTSGKVGVGTTSPWAMLSVATTTSLASPIFVVSTSTGNASLFINELGKVGISTTTPSGTFGEELTVVGNSYLKGGVTTSVSFTVGSSVAANQAAFNFSGGDLYVQNDTYLGNNATTSGNFSFNGEIMPDGLECSNGQILKKTAANNWDCASDNDTGVGTGSNWNFIPGQLVIKPTTTVGIIVSASSTIIGDFKVDGNATTTATSTVTGLKIDSLRNCDTIDTTAEGHLRCGTDGGGSGGDAFTHAAVFGQETSATSTLLYLTGSPYSLAASGTAALTQASTTQISVSNLLTVVGPANFDTGVLIDDDGAFVSASAGSLIVGDGSDTGTVEIEDAPLCVGDGGCTPDSTDGTILAEGGVFAFGLVIDSDGTFPAAVNDSIVIGDGSDTGGLELEDGGACIGDDGCTAPDDGLLLVEDDIQGIQGLVIDADGTFPTVTNGDLIIGDGSDTGIIEFEDTSVCIGDGGCTASANDGELTVAGNATTSVGLVIGATAPPQQPLLAGQLFIGAGATTTGHHHIGEYLSVAGTATSTFTGGLTIDTNTLVVNANENLVGIGITNPKASLNVSGGFIFNASSTLIGNWNFQGVGTTTGGLVIGTTVPPQNPISGGNLFIGGSATNTSNFWIGNTSNGVLFDSATGTINFFGNYRPTSTIILTAGGATPTIGDAGAATSTQTKTLFTTNRQVMTLLNFPEGSVASTSAQWTVQMPDNYDGGPVYGTLYSTATSTTGNVRWCADAVSLANTDALDATWGSLYCWSSQNVPTANTMRVSTSTLITIGGTPAKNESVIFRLTRSSAGNEDDRPDFGRLIHLKIEYRTNKLSY